MGGVGSLTQRWAGVDSSRFGCRPATLHRDVRVIAGVSARVNTQIQTHTARVLAVGSCFHRRRTYIVPLGGLNLGDTEQQQESWKRDGEATVARRADDASRPGPLSTRRLCPIDIRANITRRYQLQTR